MDSKHRHELEENDLVSSLTHFKVWWNKHGTKVLVVVLVLSLALLGKRLYDKRVKEAFESAWYGLANATTPLACAGLAEQYDDPNYQALAYLKAGDLARVQAQQPFVPATQPAAATQPVRLGDEERAKLLHDAQVMYQKSLAVAGARPLYHLNAKLGLAAVAEDKGDWDAATKLYAEIEKAAGERYHAIAQQALILRTTLAERQVPVVFGKEPAPVALPTTQPASAAPVALPLELPAAR